MTKKIKVKDILTNKEFLGSAAYKEHMTTIKSEWDKENETLEFNSLNDTDTKIPVQEPVVKETSKTELSDLLEF